MTDKELFSVVGILPEKTPAAPSVRRRRLPVLPMAVLAVIVLGCVCAPLLTGRDPAYMDLADCAAAPSARFWFGTDTMGRDIFACIWYGGRVSLTVGFLAAAIATVLNICPLMRLDNKGAIKAYDKVRGKHKAIEATVDAAEEHAQGGREYDQRCWICHSQCPELAQQLADALGERLPHVKGHIRICDIGTIIGSHAGPGTVAVFFYGDERPEMA